MCSALESPSIITRSTIWIASIMFLQPAFADMGKDGNGGVSITITSSPTVTVTVSASEDSNGPSTQTSIQPAVVPSLAPCISLCTPSNATTCMPVTFQWQATTSPCNMTTMDIRLLITNEGVQQVATTLYTSSSITTQFTEQAPAIFISRDVTNRTASALGYFTWSAVTVPAGWYTLDASLSSDYSSRTIAQSAPLLVTAGSNTTCVYATGLTLAAQSHTSMSPGAIAGTVIGSVVGAVALISAFVLPRLWRRGVPSHQAWKNKHGRLFTVF